MEGCASGYHGLAGEAITRLPLRGQEENKNEEVFP